MFGSKGRGREGGRPKGSDARVGKGLSRKGVDKGKGKIETGEERKGMDVDARGRKVVAGGQSIGFVSAGWQVQFGSAFGLNLTQRYESCGIEDTVVM
ncbi:hypothetical protein SLE2022_341780 [Rubroshorea leprosula]